mgnify:CR=1 FL=1
MIVAVLICANGLGHARRALSILSNLIKNNSKNLKIEAYIPYSHLDYLKNWHEVKFLQSKNDLVEFIDFAYPHNFENKNLIDKNWNSISLKGFKNYDMIISDNITQALEVNSKVVFTGSFFWHEVLQKMEVG